MATVPAKAVLVFLKSMATPIVLYSDNPDALYADLKQIAANANPNAPKLIEKPGAGPLRQVFFLDSQLAGAALQVDLSTEVSSASSVASGGTLPPSPSSIPPLNPAAYRP